MHLHASVGLVASVAFGAIPSIGTVCRITRRASGPSKAETVLRSRQPPHRETVGRSTSLVARKPTCRKVGDRSGDRFLAYPDPRGPATQLVKTREKRSMDFGMD